MNIYIVLTIGIAVQLLICSASPNNWFPKFAVIWLLIILGTQIYTDWRYQWKDNGDGTITSNKYGTYPKEVEYKQGMDIMPGQSARVYFSVPEEILKKTAIPKDASPEQLAEYSIRAKRIIEKIKKNPKYFEELPDCREGKPGDCMYKFEPTKKQEPAK